MRFVLRAAVGEDIGAMLGTAGYYLRTMIFPVRYDMFIPVQEAMRPFYIGFGSWPSCSCSCSSSVSLKKASLLVPTVLLALFLGAHAVLVFTDIFPYQILLSIHARARARPDLDARVRAQGPAREAPVRPRVRHSRPVHPGGGPERRLLQKQDRVLESGQRSLPRDAYVLFQSAKTSFETRIS